MDDNLPGPADLIRELLSPEANADSASAWRADTGLRLIGVFIEVSSGFFLMHIQLCLTEASDLRVRR